MAKTELPSGTKFESQTFSNDEFCHAQGENSAILTIKKCRFEDCQFSKLVLHTSNLSECVFHDCEFIDAEFWDNSTTFELSEFRNCTFRKTRFGNGCRLEDVRFDDCHFFESSIEHCQYHPRMTRTKLDRKTRIDGWAVERQYSDLGSFKHLSRNQRMTRCCLLYTSPSPRDRQKSRMPSSA